MSNRFYPNAGHFYSSHFAPVMLDCTFQVAAANGLGITGLIGNGIENVFMHTSTTPSVGNGGVTNPNPENGYIVVQLADPYFKSYANISAAIHTPNSGSSLLVASAGLTVGRSYVITILGTTSTAQWVALGVPVGVTPAVGVAFVAAATSATGTGAVQVPHVNGSGVAYVEQVGNPNLTLYPVGVGAGFPQMILRCMGPTDASTTTPIAVAPRDASFMRICFYMGNSSLN